MGYETRHYVKDLDGLKDKLEQMGFQKKEAYAFIDHIFVPKKALEGYNPETCVINLREYVDQKKNKIIISEAEFTDGVKLCEKIEISGIDIKKTRLNTLIKDKLSTNKIVNEFDIEEKFKFTRFGEEYVANDGTIVYVENVDYVGYMVEIEAEEIKKLEEQVREISAFIAGKTQKSLAKIVEERLKAKKD